MGLGKTLQTLALLQYVYKPGKYNRSNSGTTDLKKAEALRIASLKNKYSSMKRDNFHSFPCKAKRKKTPGSPPKSTNSGTGSKQNRISPLHGTLIVVPTSLLHNWKREASRFTNLSMMEYNGSSPNEITRLKKIFRPLSFDFHYLWYDA